MKKSFVILGCGNMTSSMFAHGGVAGDFSYQCYTPSQTRAHELAKKIKGEVLKTLDFSSPDILFLGHKPQNFTEIAEKIKNQINEKTLVVSIQAAISTDLIQKKLGVKKVIRLMPNTPMSLKAGVVLFFASQEVSESEKKLVSDWLKNISVVSELKNEETLDLATVITGSGPGLIFEIAKTFSQHLVASGISQIEAQQLVAQTFFGSSLMMQQEVDLQTLQNQVTSKNGVTFAALESWRQDSLSSVLKSGFEQAIKRANEISQSLKG